MILYAKGVLSNLRKTVSSYKDSNGKDFSVEYLNGQLREHSYDEQWLNVGVKIPVENMPDLNVVHNYVVQITQTFKESDNGKRICFTHCNIVDVAD